MPAPIAVRKVAASRAETVLSALKRGNVIALGLVSVNILLPTVVAPSPVLAAGAVVAPVPPLAIATVPVTLDAVPVVFWFKVGMSAATIALNVGVPATPLGAANTVFAVWLAKLDGVTAKVPPRVKLPDDVTVPVRVNPLTVPVPPTLVTVPVVLDVPAPIAVLNVAASKADTVLSALILGNVMAVGLANVKKLPPTVVAPKLVLATGAVVAPVPPLPTATVPVTFEAVPVVFWLSVGNVQFVRVPLDGVPNAPPFTTNAPTEPVLTPKAVATPVPVVMVDGATPAPPPTTKALAAKAAELAQPVELEK